MQISLSEKPILSIQILGISPTEGFIELLSLQNIEWLYWKFKTTLSRNLNMYLDSYLDLTLISIQNVM